MTWDPRPMTPDWQPSAAELKAQDRYWIPLVAQAVAVALCAYTGYWWALAVEAVAIAWVWIRSRL